MTSIKIPRGAVVDALVKVDSFSFHIDFAVLDTQPILNANSQIPTILGRPLLATSNALINCRYKVMQTSFENLKTESNIFYITRQPHASNNVYEVNLIDSLINGCNFDIDKSIEDVNTLLDSVPLTNMQ